jgi:hypothetical protein
LGSSLVVIYHFQADLVAVIHAAYIAFVVVGFILIIVGAAMDWRWVGNLYFRAVHFAAILLVCLEALVGVPCPLTVWKTGCECSAQMSYRGFFVGRLLR